MARMQIVITVDDEQKDAAMRDIAQAVREIAESDARVTKPADIREIVPQKTRAI